MMAWVEKLPSGKWRGGWRDPGGRKRYTRRPEFPEHPYARKSDARAAAQEAETGSRRKAAVAQGTMSARVTWADWWDLIRPEHPDSDSAQVAHYVVERYLRPQWGDTPMNQIQHRQVQTWVTEVLVPGRAPRYVRRIYAIFQTSLNRAVDHGVLTASPCVRVKLPAVRKRPKPYVDEAHLAVLAGIASDGRGRRHLRDPAHHDLLTVGLETGLRPGELCGMHVDQLDLDAGWAYVTHTYVRGRGVIRGYPKDKDARRVPLTAQAVSILCRHVVGRDLTAGCGVTHTDGSTCKGALVFLNKRGGHITPHALYQAMAAAAERAGVPAKSPYAVRRGFATWAAAGGLDAFAIATIMGHSDMDQTAEYVQQTPAMRDRLRAVRGEPTGVRLVAGDGADGAGARGNPGAGSEMEATGSDGTDPHETLSELD